MAHDFISIVCVTYNNELTIQRCIDSIVAQNYPSFEIIVQDRLSNDNTLEILKAYTCPIKIVSDNHSGLDEGLRKAIKRTRGSLVCFCMPQFVFLPNAFVDAVKFFEENPESGLLLKDINITDFSGHVINKLTYHGANAVKYLTAFIDVKLQYCFINLKQENTNNYYNELKNCSKGGFNNAAFTVIARHFLESSITYQPKPFIQSYNQHEGQYITLASIHKFCTERTQMLRQLLNSEPKMFGLLKKLQLQIYHNCINKITNMGESDLSDDLRERASKVEQGIHDDYIPLEILKTYARDEPEDLYLAHRLAVALYKCGRADEALECWEKTKDLLDEEIETIRLNANLVAPKSTTQSLYAEHKDWYERLVKPQLLAYERNFELNFKNRRIKVGYVCTFWNTATIRFQLLSWIQHHDYERFEVFVYYRGELPEDMPKNIEHYRIETGSSSQFINMVREDGIDILIEVNGFVFGHHFVEMASRCAPVQVSYLNYTSTCGIPEVDYVIGDDIACPTEIDKYFVEKIYRVPGSFFCFSYESEPFLHAEIPPSANKGYVTFGCFGSGGKFNRQIIELWSKLLLAVPDSVLILQNNELSQKDVRIYIEKLFKEYGVPKYRLQLLPGTDRFGVLENYKNIDISLDTWPYCGGNTIAESLWCGVPVISLKGKRFSSAYGASILYASGCADLVAQTPDEYVRIAASLAADAQRLQYYRKNLRSLMYQHGFSNTKSFATKMETAYVCMLNEKKNVYSAAPKKYQLKQPDNKLLSFVIFGRNDNYRGDYLYRIETTLCFLACNLNELNVLDLVEVIFVDSGSEVPFSEILSLSPEASKITKLLYVNPETISNYSPHSSFFHAALLANIGIRRSSGKYIMVTDTDCMMPQSALVSLLAILKGENSQFREPENYIMNIHRYQMPKMFAQRRLSFLEWKRILPTLGGCFSSEYLSANCLGGFSSGQLMHRNIWHKVRGYDEEMKGDWGWHDNALMLRVCQTYNWIDLITFGIYSFHMEHEKQVPSALTASRTLNKMIIHAPQAVNDEAWGLADDINIAWQYVCKNLSVANKTPHLPLSDDIGKNIEIQSATIDESVIDYFKSEILPLNPNQATGVPIFLQDVLPTIIAFSIKAFPLNFISFGEMHPLCLITIIKLCPAIEMLLCQPWPPGISDNHAFNPAVFSGIIEQSKYKGHARIINGDFTTCLERIYNFRPESSLIELAFINVASVRHELVTICRQLFSKLAPGAMVVIANIDKETVIRLNEVIRCSPDKYRLELVNYDHSSAILFKLK